MTGSVLPSLGLLGRGCRSEVLKLSGRWTTLACSQLPLPANLAGGRGWACCLGLSLDVPWPVRFVKGPPDFGESPRVLLVGRYQPQFPPSQLLCQSLHCYFRAGASLGCSLDRDGQPLEQFFIDRTEIGRIASSPSWPIPFKPAPIVHLKIPESVAIQIPQLCSAQRRISRNRISEPRPGESQLRLFSFTFLPFPEFSERLSRYRLHCFVQRAVASSQLELSRYGLDIFGWVFQ